MYNFLRYEIVTRLYWVIQKVRHEMKKKIMNLKLKLKIYERRQSLFGKNNQNSSILKLFLQQSFSLKLQTREIFLSLAN